MKTLLFLFIGAGILALYATHRIPSEMNTNPPIRTDKKPVPVLVELFTSEGCSSCPPADAVLARLQTTQPLSDIEIIALGEHVDYWDSLGWPDPFSSNLFTIRQQQYGRAFGRAQIYTPQLVVDGQTELVGSQEQTARTAILKAAQSPKATLHLSAQPTSTSQPANMILLNIRIDTLPSLTPGDTAEILLAMVENNLQTNVPRGENAGRKLSHTAVVRQLTVLDTMKSGQLEKTLQSSVMIRKNWNLRQLAAVVVVQERMSRRVLGVGQFTISPS